MAKKRDEQDVMMTLFRTSDRMQHRLARVVAENGLTGSQYNVLRILRAEGKPLPCLKIAQRMITVVPGITGLLDRLEEKHLVKRDRSTEDRRRVDITLTSAGETLLGKIDGPVGELQKALMSGFTTADTGELARLLEKARLNLEGEPGDEA